LVEAVAVVVVVEAVMLKIHVEIDFDTLTLEPMKRTSVKMIVVGVGEHNEY
jgi:hypothetical protein